MIALQLLVLSAPSLLQDRAELPSLPQGDGLLHLEVPDVPKLLEAYPGAPLLQMIRDEAVRSTLSELLSAAELDVGAAVRNALERVGVPAMLAADPLAAVGGMLDQLESLSFSVSLSGETPQVTRQLADSLVAVARIQAMTEKAREFQKAHEGFPPAEIAELALPEDWHDDPWGRPYRIQVDMETLGFRIESLGADGVEGGTGFDSDLSSDGSLENHASELFAATLDVVTRVEFTGAESAARAWDLSTTALESELGSRPGGRRELSVRGKSARVCELPDLPGTTLSPWLFAVDREISAGLGRDALARALARAQTESGKLRSSPNVQQVAEHLGPARGAIVASGWIELDRVDALLSSVERGLAELGEANVNFMRLSGSGLFRMQLDGDRFLSDYAYNVSADSALARCAGAAPVPERLWNFIPSETIGVYASSIDGQAIYDEIMRNITGVHGERPKALERIEREHGFSIEKDLIGNLGDGAAAYLLPIAGVISLPGIAVVVELRDAPAFQRGLDAVLKLLEEQAGGEFSVRYKPYRDQPLWTFSFGGDDSGFAGPIQISPTLAIVQSHLLVSLTSTRAKKEIKRLLDAEPQERHRLFSARGAPPADAGTITFMDWPGLMNGTYDGAKAALAMFSGMLEEMPIDAQALPPASTFTRFFEPSVSWTRAVEPDLRLTHSESSFGPETLLGLAGGAGALALAVVELRSASIGMERVEVEEQAEAPVDEAAAAATEESLAALDWLATRLEVYRIENGSYPRSLSTLTQPTQGYPKGYLDGGGMPADGWGRALIYEPAPDGKSFRLWSPGKNGSDERGGGDDVSLP
jgi:hypothetical protein